LGASGYYEQAVVSKELQYFGLAWTVGSFGSDHLGLLACPRPVAKLT